jgi:thymidylate kinase
MIIEFFGKIGSGKTTIAKRLSERNNLEFIRVKSKREKYLFSMFFIILHPIRSFYLIQKCFGGKFTKRKLALVQFNMARYQKAKMKKGVNILDEGFLQAIFSILDYELERDEIKKYLRTIPRSDVVVIIEVGEKGRKKRLNKRGYDLPEKMFEKDYGKKWEESMRENYEKIKEIIGGSIKVIKIGNKTIKKSIEEIINKLK